MLRDLFIKDWGWKLFSLFLAVTIWFTVHRILEPEVVLLTNQTSRVTYENLPVTIVSAVADTSGYRAAPPIVRVTVSGPPEVMDQLQKNQVRAVVDLANLKDTSEQVNILTPPNVTVTRIEPQTVSILAPPKP